MSGVLSMTGFGSAAFEAAGFRYRVDLKTVNHKHLNVRLHLPDELGAGESDALRLLRDHVTRGSVDVSVALEGAGERGLDVEIDEAGARTLRDALSSLASTLDLPGPSLELVLRLGDFVKIRKASVDPDELGAAFLGGLSAAIDELNASRQVEGAHLAADIGARLATLERLLDLVEEASPRIQEAFELKLRGRLDDLARKFGGDLDEGRLATELVLYSDKSDVTEETVRARTHVGAFRELLTPGSGDAQGLRGKRLDFLAQELNREFNTIGSKCRDAGMATAVVDAKVELERIREQIQNIA